MITVPIYTRLLSTEQYGMLSVYQSWYSIFSVFITLNLYNGVFNNGMIKYEKEKHSFISSLQGIITTVTIGALIIYAFNVEIINKLLGMSSLLVIVMFTELLFSSAFLLWSAGQRFEYKYRTMLIVTILVSVASPIIGIIAVLNTSYKGEARILSFSIVQIIVGIVFYFYNIRKGKKCINKEFWKFALAFNIPLIPHYLSQSILQQSDRIMIDAFVGKDKAAIYSVAYNISTLMLLITTAINNSFIPYTYKCIKSKSFDGLKKSVNVLIVLVGIGCMGIVAFGPEIISFFAPVEYYEAIWIIPPVAASVYFMFLYPIFGNVEFYFEEKRFVAVASVLGAILNIVLNYLCIPLFGYIAAGYTTLLCYMIFTGSHYVFMKFVLKKHMSNQKVYDMKFIVMFSIAMLVMMFGMLFVYRMAIIRYIVLIAIMIFLLWKKNYFIACFKGMKKS